EHWLTSILLLAYVGLAALLYPAFFTRILPDVRNLYVPDRMSLAALLVHPPLWTIYAIGIAMVSLFRQQARRNPGPVLTVALASCLVVFVVEGKGWPYQVLPGSILAMLLLIVMMLGERGPVSPRSSLLALSVLTVLPAVAAILGALFVPDPLLAAVARFGPGLRIGTISTDLDLANPLARDAGEVLVNSTPMMWYARGALMGAMRHPPAEDMEQLARFAEQDRQLLLEDFERQPPDLILAEVPPSYDWLAWARRDPALDAILEQFQEVDRIKVGDGTIAVLRRGNQTAPK
ncbi:MAG: hypothetical protein ACTHOR_15060, partial [Devosia sp.]